MFNKFVNRQKQLPTNAEPVAQAGVQSKTRPVASAVLAERRRFPRPLPLPEVVEHDWDVWVNETQANTPKPPGGAVD